MIGAIVRGGQVIIPRGNTVIKHTGPSHALGHSRTGAEGREDVLRPSRVLLIRRLSGNEPHANVGTWLDTHMSTAATSLTDADVHVEDRGYQFADGVYEVDRRHRRPAGRRRAAPGPARPRSLNELRICVADEPRVLKT